MGTDTVAGELVLEIISFLAFILPFLLVPFAFKFAGSGLHKLYNSAQNGVQSAARRSGRFASNRAKNSTYGIAAQQFMANRKGIKQLKGKEALRGGLNSLDRNSTLGKLIMGGKYGNRFLDAENRRHEAEQVANLKQGLTSNVADAIASQGLPDVGEREDLGAALRNGVWSKGIRKGKQVTAADQAAILKLRQEGYVDQNFNAKPSPELAKAALGSIMDVEIASPENVQALAGMLRGHSAQENASFTEHLQAEAGKHGYKNLQYGSVTDGKLEQFYVKGPDAILASGLAGVNKDALDPEMDTSLLRAIRANYEKAVASGDPGAADAYVRKIAEQTKHIDKDKIVQAIAAQLQVSSEGRSQTRDPVTGEVHITYDTALTTPVEGFMNDFQALRSSIKSQGAMPMPTRFASSSPTAAAAAPAPPPQDASTLVIPRAQAAPRQRPGLGAFSQPQTPPPPPPDNSSWPPPQ